MRHLQILCNGLRISNGVVLVTTKKGKSNESSEYCYSQSVKVALKLNEKL